MSVKQEREKAIEELNLDVSDPYTNLIVQCLALRAEVDSLRAQLKMKEPTMEQWVQWG